MHTGKKLQKIRKRAGMSLFDLYFKSTIQEKTMRKIERRARPPRFLDLAKIAQAYEWADKPEAQNAVSKIFEEHPKYRKWSSLPSLITGLRYSH